MENSGDQYSVKYSVKYILIHFGLILTIIVVLYIISDIYRWGLDPYQFLGYAFLSTLALVILFVGIYHIHAERNKIDFFEITSPKTFINIILRKSWLFAIICIPVGIFFISINLLSSFLFGFELIRLSYDLWFFIILITGIMELINGCLILKFKSFNVNLNIIAYLLNILTLLWYLIICGFGMLFYSLLVFFHFFFVVLIYQFIFSVLKILKNKDLLNNFSLL